MCNHFELWQEYKERKSAKAREDLILIYAHLAKFAVDRLAVRPSGPVSYEDLIGHAAVGLIDAADRFEPARDVEFEVYALQRIRGAVLDALRTLDWVPRSVRRDESALRAAYREIEQREGRPASDREIASEMGVTVDELERMLARVGDSAVLSLDDIIASAGEEEEQAIIGSPATTEDANPAVIAEYRDRVRILGEAIDQLPERERLTMSLYYYENLTMKEIAKVLGVTESRVCQLHSKAVLRLGGKLGRVADALLLAS